MITYDLTYTLAGLTVAIFALAVAILFWAGRDTSGKKNRRKK